MAPTHQLTQREKEVLRKLSNKIYDILANDLDISLERADALTGIAIDAIAEHLEEGK